MIPYQDSFVNWHELSHCLCTVGYSHYLALKLEDFSFVVSYSLKACTKTYIGDSLALFIFCHCLVLGVFHKHGVRLSHALNQSSAILKQPLKQIKKKPSVSQLCFAFFLDTVICVLHTSLLSVLQVVHFIFQLSRFRMRGWKSKHLTLRLWSILHIDCTHTHRVLYRDTWQQVRTDQRAV